MITSRKRLKVDGKTVSYLKSTICIWTNFPRMTTPSPKKSCLMNRLCLSSINYKAMSCRLWIHVMKNTKRRPHFGRYLMTQMLQENRKINFKLYDERHGKFWRRNCEDDARLVTSFGARARRWSKKISNFSLKWQHHRNFDTKIT